MHNISTGLAQCFLNHLVFDHFINENGFLKNCAFACHWHNQKHKATSHNKREFIFENKAKTIIKA